MVDFCHLTRYYQVMQSELGRILKNRRLMIPITARQLALRTGVSAAHIARIEKGERFPSARVLHKLARPLGFGERELLTLAGFRAANTTDEIGGKNQGGSDSRIDPYVSKVLGQESSEVQRMVIRILYLVKRMAKAEAKRNR